MWANRGRLPVVLEREHFVCPAHYERELAAMFLPGFHCVGTLDDVPRDGDFLTTELLGRPLLVRNAGGSVRAFLNVCAHRHALLTSEPLGRCERLRCQYHGWEYDDAGAVCKIPDARSFVPIKRGDDGLKSFRCEVLGKLIFVSLAAEGPSLAESLPEATRAFALEAFGPRYRQVARWELTHRANWKVPVESTLESYHVPVVHPRVYCSMPAEEDEDHTLGEGYTSYEDRDQEKILSYRLAVRAFRRSPRYTFRHHHAFPSLTMGDTDATSYLHVVLPTSPVTSRSMVRAFVYKGDPGFVAGRLLSSVSDAPIRWFIGNILAEDGAILSDIHDGLASPDKPGAGSISAREERVHAFRAWVQKAAQESAAERRCAG